MLISAASAQFQTPKGFLVLDGVNGAGKTTLIKRIESYLTPEHAVVTTREPGATRVGKELRSILLEGKAGPVSAPTEILLFAADRAEHVQKVIRPSIAEHKIVLCDRYYYSTIAFQGYGRQLPLHQIEAANAIAVSDCYPDCVILLDLPPEEGLRRTSRRNSGEVDTFEHEELEFHRRLRKGFLELAQSSREPFLVVNAEQTPDQVFQQVIPLIERWKEALRSSPR